MLPKMTVYFQPTCGPCRDFKKWLDENNISYIGKDVSNDIEAFNEFQSKGFQFTPTTIIVKDNKEHVVIGFNKPKIKQLLGLIH